MQSVSSKIWTRVAVSISYDDNLYTTPEDIYILLRIFWNSIFGQECYIRCWAIELVSKRCIVSRINKVFYYQNEFEDLRIKKNNLLIN